jgi:hypothetical protein
MSRHYTKPNRADVLASFAPGRVTRLALGREQKQALRDRDGHLALSVVRHLLGARCASVKPATPYESFPLTEHTFQALAVRLGRRVGIKRSRALVRRLIAAGVIREVGSYRQPYRNQAGCSGFRVRSHSREKPKAGEPRARKRVFSAGIDGDSLAVDFSPRKRARTRRSDARQLTRSPKLSGYGGIARRSGPGRPRTLRRLCLWPARLRGRYRARAAPAPLSMRAVDGLRCRGRQNV